MDKQPLAIATDEISRFKPSDVISMVFRDGIYEKDDMCSLDYYPIYKFFGSKKSAATPHVVYFDLLVWMLMKKFTSIRAELKEAIEKNTEAVNKNTEVMNAALTAFNELHPDAKRVFFNHGYRDIIIENGKVMCEILKDSERLHELTYEKIKKLKFL